MAENNIAGTNLKEPDQIDWSNYNPGGKYQAPPPALDASGKSIVYYGQAPQFKMGSDGKLLGEEETDEGYLQVIIDPVKIVKSGSADNYEVRFARANTKQFVTKAGKVINANGLGNFLRAAGVTAKPQKNNEYRSAVVMTSGKVFPFTVDWFAKDKETGERVQGYSNFPVDPERPGQRKSILKAGDTYTVSDKQGNITETKTVKAEVLFANAQLRYFVDPNRK